MKLLKSAIAIATALIVSSSASAELTQTDVEAQMAIVWNNLLAGEVPNTHGATNYYFGFCTSYSMVGDSPLYRSVTMSLRTNADGTANIGYSVSNAGDKSLIDNQQLPVETLVKQYPLKSFPSTIETSKEGNGQYLSFFMIAATPMDPTDYYTFVSAPVGSTDKLNLVVTFDGVKFCEMEKIASAN